MIAWLDLETTGLNPADEITLEVGSIVTDDALNEIGRFQTVLHCSSVNRAFSDSFVQEMHDKSGLWEECYKSEVTPEIADGQLQWFWEECKVDNTVPLAGSSVHFDRGFMEADLPISLAMLHYRQLDVSSLKITFDKFFPDHAYPKAESKAHRALDDIEASIAEYQYYLHKMKEGM